MSEAQKFQTQLGEELASLFSGEFKFYRSRSELRRKVDGGNDVIILAGAHKWSPHVSVDFYFGKSFDRVAQVEKLVERRASPYHIQQYSVNRRRMKGLKYGGPYTWTVDLRHPPAGLAGEVKQAIEGMAYPFFERFRDLTAARDALAADDSWCFGAVGAFWRSLFFVDAALDDLAHFKQWSKSLEPFYAAQAKETLDEYGAALRR